MEILWLCVCGAVTMSTWESVSAYGLRSMWVCTYNYTMWCVCVCVFCARGVCWWVCRALLGCKGQRVCVCAAGGGVAGNQQTLSLQLGGKVGRQKLGWEEKKRGGQRNQENPVRKETWDCSDVPEPHTAAFFTSSVTRCENTTVEFWWFGPKNNFSVRETSWLWWLWKLFLPYYNVKVIGTYVY